MRDSDRTRVSRRAAETIRQVVADRAQRLAGPPRFNRGDEVTFDGYAAQVAWPAPITGSIAVPAPVTGGEAIVVFSDPTRQGSVRSARLAESALTPVPDEIERRVAALASEVGARPR